MLQTVRAEKVDEKNGIICLVFMFPSWVMVCKLFKKVHFLQFCADLSKKSKSVKAIYIYASERSHYTLSENAMVYRVWATVHEKLKKIKYQKRCWFSRNLTEFFDFKH